VAHQLEELQLEVSQWLEELQLEVSQWLEELQALLLLHQLEELVSLQHQHCHPHLLQSQRTIYLASEYLLQK
jgi:hypothetical protein